MAMMMKLNNIDNLSGGRKRFRRRFPKEVAHALGKEYMQVAMKVREGVALVQEHAALMKEFDRAVSVAKGETSLTPREQWEQDRAEVEDMLSSIKGIPDDGGHYDNRRQVLGHSLVEVGGYRPSLVEEVLRPAKVPPQFTLADARQLYLNERVGDDADKVTRLDRTCRRMETTLGPLKDFPLVDLKRSHARALRDALLSTPAEGKKGRPLSVTSVGRELSIVSAMVGLAIREFDLADTMSNPFEKLEMPRATTQTLTARDDRDPLPADVIKAMRVRLKSSAKSPDLLHLWNILAGTGCRLAEVSGLLVEDVHLDHEVPHIHIRPNSIRSLKTRVSIRKVPLVGLAKEAAAAAVNAALASRPNNIEGIPLFPAYAKPRGADSASQVLMKHLRTVTDNPRNTNHSLRHSMKDWLREAGVPALEQNLILGHTLGGEGDTAYGGEQAKLRVVYRALMKVQEIGLMP